MWMQPVGQQSFEMVEQPTTISEDERTEFRPLDIKIMDPLGGSNRHPAVATTTVDQANVVCQASTLRDEESLLTTTNDSSEQLSVADQAAFESFASDLWQRFECKACKSFTTDSRQEMALHARYYHGFNVGGPATDRLQLRQTIAPSQQQTTPLTPNPESPESYQIPGFPYGKYYFSAYPGFFGGVF